MALAVGNKQVEDIKLGDISVLAMYLGTIRVWPEPKPDPGGDIDVDELKEALSVITMGYWQDALPWSDKTPWVDKLSFN